MIFSLVGVEGEKYILFTTDLVFLELLADSVPSVPLQLMAKIESKKTLIKNDLYLIIFSEIVDLQRFVFAIYP